MATLNEKKSKLLDFLFEIERKSKTNTPIRLGDYQNDKIWKISRFMIKAIRNSGILIQTNTAANRPEYSYDSNIKPNIQLVNKLILLEKQERQNWSQEQKAKKSEKEITGTKEDLAEEPVIAQTATIQKPVEKVAEEPLIRNKVIKEPKIPNNNEEYIPKSEYITINKANFQKTLIAIVSFVLGLVAGAYFF